MIFRRRRKLPAELRPPLARDERVVAWARATGLSGAEANRGAAEISAGSGAGQEATDSAHGNEVVVATNLGLFLPGAAERLGWHEIHKAAWTGGQLVVTPAELVEQREGYVVMADRSPVPVALAEPGDLPTVVRTRVTRSVSFTSHHPVPGGGVRVVARRIPGNDGLNWAVRYDEGTDPHDPGVVEATDQLIAAHTAAQQVTP